MHSFQKVSKLIKQAKFYGNGNFFLFDFRHFPKTGGGGGGYHNANILKNICLLEIRPR